MAEDKFKMADEGKRKTYSTGAIEEVKTGKGKYVLISPYMLLRLARIMEKGAIKYADRNWEKGMPFSRFTDSALRHINQFLMGMTDEDHLGQAIFNLMAIMHFQDTGRTDLDDMPHYEEKKNATQSHS
jgi:hypothetical protein